MQRIHAQALQFRKRLQPGNFIHIQKTETPRIAVLKLAPVVKLNHGMRVAEAIARKACVPESSRHPQVNKPEGLRLQLHDQIFAPAMDRTHDPTLQPQGKIPRNRPPQGFARQDDPGYALSGDGAAQLAGDGFNFRQFWHGTLSGWNGGQNIHK